MKRISLDELGMQMRLSQYNIHAIKQYNNIENVTILTLVTVTDDLCWSNFM